jgi:hypothetical protein
MNHLLRPRNREAACGTERSVASANYMAVLPSVLGCSFDRLRTGSPCNVPFRYASDQSRGTVTRWRAHLSGLATAIHILSGLEVWKQGENPFIRWDLSRLTINQTNEFGGKILIQGFKNSKFLPC